MTRDDIPAGAEDPHRRPDPDAARALDLDGADAPSLAAARDAWRALREPLAPGPELDARIRAAARRASAGPRPVGGSPPSGGATAARVPAPSRHRVRRYAGWGLALAATLVGGIVLVLPPAPLAEAPREAPPQAAPTSGADAAAVVEHAPPPAHVPPVHVSMPAATADGAANARVEPVPQAPVTSGMPDADVQAGSVQSGAARAAARQGVMAPPAPAPAVAAPGAETRAEVEAAFTAPPAAVTAPSPSSAREGPPPTPAAASAAPPVARRAADAASRDDVDSIERELAELRLLLRARDPALPARLRAFVARYPEHPLARMDPALAEMLARDPARP